VLSSGNGVLPIGHVVAGARRLNFPTVGKKRFASDPT
jgi:hypothetical protein